MTPLVSIIILNHNHPEIIDVCLNSLKITEGVEYEVVVVDNGSTDPGVPALLERHQRAGNIDVLAVESQNWYFSEGNNIGVRKSNPQSEYILLLNSDVAVLRPDWLTKALAWMEGTIEYAPSVWGSKPTVPSPGPKDIISIGWSHDVNVVPGNARPEGWCCLIRRKVFRELSNDIPWHGGFEEMIASVIREGARCGVLSQYAPYMVHREGGSGKIPTGGAVNKRQPDIGAWFSGLPVETLDFTLGPDEHDSYLKW